jgi:hypothetical protein
MTRPRPLRAATPERAKKAKPRSLMREVAYERF